jgi:hypothetical protein
MFNNTTYKEWVVGGSAPYGEGVVGGSPPYGEGLLTRDVGRYPPSMRKLLNEVGNETITKITIFKYPLVEVSALAKFFSNKKIPYDEVFHLGININGKYNLDKDRVLSFVRGVIPTKRNTQTMDVIKVPIKPKLSINALLEQTRLRIGNEKMTEYNAFRNNCQDFVMNLLITGDWSTPDTTKFINQNVESFLKDLPKGTELITNAFTKVGAIVDRLKHGEGDTFEKASSKQLEDGVREVVGTVGSYIEVPISNTQGIPPATDTDFFMRAPSSENRTVFGGSWGTDGKQRPYFGNGVPTTSNLRMVGNPPNPMVQTALKEQMGRGGINYAEQRVPPYVYDLRTNFEPVPDYIQNLSIQNIELRSG